MGARSYDHHTHTFVQPDPVIPDLRNPQTLNRYAYALNNPLRYVDPSGHCVDPAPGSSETRYCIDRFIEDVSMWLSAGDDRGPVANPGCSAPRSGECRNTARIRHLIGPDGSLEVIPGISRFLWAEGLGPIEELAYSVNVGDAGRTILLRSRTRHGVLPATPSIVTEIAIHEGLDGSVSVSATGTRYPALEVWRYGPEGAKLLHHFSPNQARTSPWQLLGGRDTLPNLGGGFRWYPPLPPRTYHPTTYHP